MDPQTTPSRPNRLIAVDLDGTLVASDGTVSAENVRAIERAGREGAAVVIVTGRPYLSADSVAQQLGLPPVPLVAFNGAIIRWPNGGDTLYRCQLPAELAAEVVEEVFRRQLHLHYYLDDQMYVTAYNQWAEMYCRRNGMSYIEEPDMRRFAGEEPLKLLVVDEPSSIDLLLPRFTQRWRDQLYVTRSMAEYIEFLSPSVSKGHALDWLIDFYDVDRDQTLAIGDAMNDLPLLEHAGCTAAMPAADEELKSIAQFVPTEQPTGVAQAIEWFLERT